MVGLLDIAPLARTVPVSGVDVAVYGVSAEGIASLLGRFPQLASMIGMEAEKAQEGVTAEAIIKVAPTAIAAIIAAGCGYPGNPEAEERAAQLSVDAQLDLISAIIELTMPKGVNPFIEKLEAAMGKLGDVSVKAPAIKSP